MTPSLSDGSLAMKDIERQHYVVIPGVLGALVEPANIILDKIVELTLFRGIIDLDCLRGIPAWKDLLSAEIHNLLFEPSNHFRLEIVAQVSTLSVGLNFFVDQLYES